MTEEENIEKKTSQEELLKEIFKTDKVIENFVKAVKVLRNHKDKSNSQKLKNILEMLKDFDGVVES